MTHPSKIQQLWELFIQSEHSSYEKSTWLDVFLAEFLTQVYEGKCVEDVLSFCLVGGVATLIGCELLTDVHQICSQPGDGEDLAPLCHYLLHGRGWRSLAVLHSLGVQNLSCGRELASLLISLYPVCLQKPTQKKREVSVKNSYIPKKPLCNIEDVFRIRTPLKNKFRLPSFSHNSNLCPPTRADFQRSFSNASAGRFRRTKATNSADGAKGNVEGVTSESEHLEEDFDTLPSKASTLKIRLDPMDFDYFTSVVRSEDEARLDSHNYTPHKRSGRDFREERKFPDDFKDERVMLVLNSEICSYEFFQLVIQLLQSLCTSEMSVASDNGHQIAIQAINFSLENLCSLQFGSAPTEQFTSAEVAELKSAMTQLLLAALEKVLIYSDITMTVIRSGMLPVLLKVLEDAICKISAATKSVEEVKCVLEDSVISKLQTTTLISEPEACKIQEFIFGCMYGIITFLYCLLLQRCTVDKFRDFLELFQLFAESHSGRLVEKTITAIVHLPHVNSQISISRAKKVIDLTGQLIAALKKVRSEIIHSHQCRKTRHKQCINTAALETHHHHDLFGAVYSTSIVTASPHHACCIASLFMVLVRLLNSNNLQIESRVMKVMMMCGTCCCFPVRSLITPLLEIIKKNGSRCRHLVFALLERTIYSELGAITLVDNKISCVICYKSTLIVKSVGSDYSVEESYETVKKGHTTKEYQMERINSKSGDSEKHSLVTSLEVPTSRNPWSCLELFQELLQSSDIKLCHDITSHLLKVSPRCTPNVKQELLFNVFYPTFCFSKHQYLSTECDISKFNVLSCLSIFSSLLGSITFAEFFISQGGLNHILDLISLPVFSKLCCSVLEMIAIVEIWKLESEVKVHNGSGSQVCDLKQLPSLRMLQNAMEASSRRLLSIFDKYARNISTNHANDSEVNSIAQTESKFCNNKVHENNAIMCSEVDDKNSINTEDSALKYFNDAKEDVDKNRANLSYTEHKMCKVNLSQEDCDTYCQLLPIVCVFWRSCANLVVSSPSFRAHLQRQPVAEDAGRLLVCALDRVVQDSFFIGKSKEEVANHFPENNFLMKLMEATLTVSLATSKSVKSQLEVLPESHNIPSEIEIANLQSSLLRSDLTCNVNVRQLCEVLIRSAVAECCQEQVMPPNRKPKLPALCVTTTWDESLSDADEDLDTTELSNDCSSLDDTYITADEGYEADIELLDVGVPLHTNAGTMADDSSSLGSPGGVSGSGWSEYGRNHNIMYPSLCILTLDFLIHLNNRYLKTVSNSGNTNKTQINGNDAAWSELPSETHLQNLVHCIQRLVALCRDNPQNCIILAKSNVIEKLLDGFSSFLKVQNSNYAELQNTVLELVTHIARYSITPQELSLYLNFFKANNPPLEVLLTPLTSLVTSSRPQPNYILCFPAESPVTKSVEDSENVELNVLTHDFPGDIESKNFQPYCLLKLTPTLGEDLAGNLAATLYSKHTEAGVVSAWSRCAIALPINTELGWSMWMHGFSVSLWLRLERGSNAGTANLVHIPSYPSSLLSDSASGSLSDWGLPSDNIVKEGNIVNSSGVKPVSSGSVLHIFSIGYENLVLEAWADPCSDTLTLKWSRPEVNSNEILCESTVENTLSIGQWHHLAINVRDYVQNKKVVIEVLLLVDGWREVKVLMTYSGLLVRKLRPVCLLLGHCTSANGTKPVGSWYLGSVMLFRCPVFTKERATYLVGLGPNYTNLTDCEVDRISPNFTSVFGPKTLSVGIDWEMILDAKKGNLKELQDNLLLTYSAQNPNVVNMYPQVMTNPGGVVGTLFPGQPSFRVITVEQRASQQLPLSAQPMILARLNSQQYHGLVAAASVLGGTPVFLFLLARVVELNASQQAQAKALFLLLKLVQADCELFAQFVNQDGHKLLLKVLASTRCIAGHHMLKAVLDTCCDKTVLHYHPGTQKFHIASQSDAIIVNSFLLSTIVGSWRDWERAGEDQMFCEGGGVLGTLFRSLHVLLRDDHPFREFNATQLNRVRMVEALLLFCKERFLYEESLQLHVSVCCSLVELIRSLMGAPPEFSHIVAVTDFLVLLHQASATYVTHVRPSFYFLLSPLPPNVHMNSVNTTICSSHMKELRHDVEKTGIFQIDSDRKVKSATEIFVNDLKKKETEKFAQPIDPQKLNKALTNLQIQQCTGESHGDTEASSSVQRSDSNSSAAVDSNKVNDLTIDSGIVCCLMENRSSSGQEVIRISTPDFVDQSNIISHPFSDSAINKFKPIKGTISASVLSEVTHEDKGEGKALDQPVNKKTECKENSDVEKFTTETGYSDMTRGWPEENPKPTQASLDNSTIVGEGEKWFGSSSGKGSSQSLVVEGLLLLLRDTLLVLPDNMAHQVLNHVVKAEALLVMANHADPRVRTAVVKVLSAYLQRSTDEEINKFLKIKGFYQLANQLSLFPASLELVEACVALVTRCSVSLEEQAEITLLTDLTFLQANSFPPLLALLPRCVHDTALTHNLIIFLREVFTKSLKSQSLRTLLDCGLLESLEKTVIAVAHMPPEPSDLCGIPEQDLLVGDVQVFLMTIVGQVLRSAGAHHMQVINDLQLQLSYLERTERAKCGVHAPCVTSLRDTQCVVLEGSLDILQDKITSVQSFGSKLKNTSFFSSVLSTSYEELYHMTCEPPTKIDQSASAHQLYSYVPNTDGKVHSGIHNKEVPRSELNERIKSIIVKSVDFLTNVELIDGRNPLTVASELNFSRRLLASILQGLRTVLEKRSSSQRTVWTQVMWAARDTLRVQSAKLLVWLISPAQPVKMRMFCVHTLRSEQRCKELMLAMLHTHMQLEQKFHAFLWELTNSSENLLAPADIRTCEELRDQLESWGMRGNVEQSSWPDEVRLLMEDIERQSKAWEKHNESATVRSVYKFEGLMKTVAEAAMSITRLVVEAQNSERKVFMEHIKLAYSENVQIRIKWQKIVQQLTHERAVWFFSDSYPQSWQLDATEGPARVRNRLQRCHLGIQSKYLMVRSQQKSVDTVKREDPLFYLFEQDKQSSTSTVLIERLHTNEKIQHMCPARVITPANEVPGELLIGESCLYFVADDSILGTDLSEVTAGSLDVSSTAWQFECVKEIHNRRFQLQERALEIFLTNGKTYLVAFEAVKERDTFVWELSQCHLPNRVVGDNLTDVVQMWRDGLITNWEYLTQLNKMAGRSFNDLMQYPVFPFVLSDYTSSVLNLHDPKVYRNFKKPMAVQDKRNEQHYINNYNYLKQELQESNLMKLNQEPYHYGSHYSNSGTVLHFLVRLPPFTRMFLSYQDDNFDLPDRTFHSLYTTWRLASTDSTTDVKELIPEFFFLSEFLLNSEGFNFGIRQNGERVHHVYLPPWCEGDPRRFVLVHRQALESDFVRENIPHWIDLVFGYKQTGKMAVDAINVFHPATYYGFNVEAIKDPVERSAWETMVRTYGQTPRQLFRSAHPMVVQSLTSHTSVESLKPVIPGVKGLVWGSYVGSPSDPEPLVVWKHQHRTPVANLVALLTNDVFGLAPQTSLLLCYSKEKGLSMINTTSVLGAALVTWGHPDSIIRAKLKKEQPPWPVVKSGGLDPINICASVPDCNQLWLGHCSGKLVVFEYKFDPGKGVLDFQSDPVTLLGHTEAVTSLYICRSFSIVASGSQDTSTIFWDLNNLSYVRSIPKVGAPVHLVCVSETMGDVATVSHTNNSSTLRLYTINASLVGSVNSSVPITALCFSSAPEGISVNVIATGLASGAVRLWSTWDLSFVREITCNLLNRPVISITYSYDSQHLYASAADGIVIIWEAAGTKGVSRTPKFLNLTSL